ncbi:MAG: hypothetical protein FWG90_01070 [Oscillospiraceae bacterium]|nr:hypothetical protein [Oscillospiraceae bacterium]
MKNQVFLCDRCVKNLKNKAGKFVVGEVVENSDNTCEWCEISDSDLYIVSTIFSKGR